jgi:hypothetical protein
MISRGLKEAQVLHENNARPHCHLTRSLAKCRAHHINDTLVPVS